jgi:hypothetical protein
VLHDDHQVIVASGAQQTPTGGFAFSAIVPPGDYTLKVGAIDRLGRRGTVERSIHARVETRGFSDLILAMVPPSAGASLQPIVDRAPRDRMLAYLELYPQTPDATAGASVTVDIMRAADSTVVSSSRAVFHPGPPGLVVARAIVPVRALPPGRYVARATVAMRAQPEAIVTRAFSVE